MNEETKVAQFDLTVGVDREVSGLLPAITEQFIESAIMRSIWNNAKAGCAPIMLTVKASRIKEEGNG